MSFYLSLCAVLMGGLCLPEKHSLSRWLWLPLTGVFLWGLLNCFWPMVVILFTGFSSGASWGEIALALIGLLLPAVLLGLLPLFVRPPLRRSAPWVSAYLLLLLVGLVIREAQSGLG